MRKPRIGEYTHCGICFDVCEIVDEDYINYWNKLDKKAQKEIYEKEEDVFLSYDRCES